MRAIKCLVMEAVPHVASLPPLVSEAVRKIRIRTAINDEVDIYITQVSEKRWTFTEPQTILTI